MAFFAWELCFDWMADTGFDCCAGNCARIGMPRFEEDLQGDLQEDLLF